MPIIKGFYCFLAIFWLSNSESCLMAHNWTFSSDSKLLFVFVNPDSQSYEIDISSPVEISSPAETALINLPQDLCVSGVYDRESLELQTELFADPSFPSRGFPGWGTHIYLSDSGDSIVTVTSWASDPKRIALSFYWKGLLVRKYRMD
ncbi:MAG: hypothetical protein AAF514_21465, partial [Verrucomicrobiota bacterium]